MEQRLARIEAKEAALAAPPPKTMRTPFFCSGCPHNSSTKVPDGSRAGAGIGCHGMAIWMPERRTQPMTHMGAEGVTWVGQSPFTEEEHIFQNLGDGTYYHSGLLAIRAACLARGAPRLPDCALYVTLEPCPMCAAAISFARLARVYYGAADPKGGGVEHGPRVFHQPTCHHRPELYPGIADGEAADLLRAFFSARR